MLRQRNFAVSNQFHDLTVIAIAEAVHFSR
jgi:hypothetical protein